MNHPDPLTLNLADAHRARVHRWKRHLKGGSVSRFWWEDGRTRSETLATFFMGGAPAGHCWQHVTGNRDDFRREKLVAVPRGQKLRTSARRAVGVTRAGKRYRARLQLPGRSMRHLGMFDTLQDAADAVDLALMEAGLRPVNALQ